MTKNVIYKGKSYKVQYNYQQARGINEPRENKLYLLNEQNDKLFCLEWKDTYKQRKSIIGKVKELIDNYLKEIYIYNDLMYFNEFEQWNGNLDSWDE